MEQEPLIPGFSEPIQFNEEQGAEVQPPQKNSKTAIIIAVIVIIAALGIIYISRKENAPERESGQPAANLETGDRKETAANKPLTQDNTAVSEQEGESYNVYFSRAGEDCSRVYPLKRELKEGEEPISTALINLFFGPTAAEREAGYNSFFSKATDYILHSAKVRKGVAYVDIKDIRNIIPNASSSCGSAQLLAQIRETLQQFPEINDFRVAIDGEPAPFYEWLQIGCADNLCDQAPFQFSGTGQN
ncbi:MAG: GerMN domain-containing protein [Patescibacteria group bacterium]